jgi:hypothetical protein
VIAATKPSRQVAVIRCGDGDLTANALGVADTESPTDANGSCVNRLAPLIELDRTRGRQPSVEFSHGWNLPAGLPTRRSFPGRGG